MIPSLDVQAWDGMLPDKDLNERAIFKENFFVLKKETKKRTPFFLNVYFGKINAHTFLMNKLLFRATGAQNMIAQNIRAKFHRLAMCFSSLFFRRHCTRCCFSVFTAAVVSLPIGGAL